MSNKKILLSGITPSGTSGLHIGNYFGAIKQFGGSKDGPCYMKCGYSS